MVTVSSESKSVQRADLSRIELIRLLAKPRTWKRPICLAGINLAGMDLRWLSLSHVDFYGADLSECDLRNAHLRGCQFTWARLVKADLRGAHMSCDCEGDAVIANNATFAGANLEGTFASELTAEHAQFDYANLRGTKLDGAWLWGSTFHGADLSNANFTSAKLSRGIQERAKHTDGIILADVAWNTQQIIEHRE